VVQRNLRCDPQRLRLLLEERLPAPQETELVGHLDHCRHCQLALEGLAADKTWWDELRRIADAEGPCTRALEGDETPPGPEAVLPLDFLDPADDPSQLGKLGTFAITAVLGRGGMGIVLKGFDAALNRPVAIKLLAPYFASSAAARKRFAREAQAAAAVVHEHVVAIHGVDTWKGLPYLVMSFVNGRSLQDRLDAEGPLGVREVLRIGMQTAAGLAAAHAQGLVHRDVKPANILLENGLERVKITDFGLARAVDDARLTQSGVIAGTPQYMAPEQANAEPVDHRADLFSLGCVLYAMCTGHPPFRAESAMAVLRRVCHDRPRPIRSLNPDVPIWLASLIDRLLAKSPAERFQTAAEVADLLGACLAHLQQPDAIPLPPAVAAGWRGPSRGRYLAWAAALALVLTLGAAVADRWPWRDPSPATTADVIPPSRGEPPARGDDLMQRREAVPRPVIQGLSGTPLRAEDPLERPLHEIRSRVAEVGADIRRPAGSGCADPADEAIRRAWQRIEALHRDLDSPAH
jgi:serine/threonine-protein kinase